MDVILSSLCGALYNGVDVNVFKIITRPVRVPAEWYAAPLNGIDHKFQFAISNTFWDEQKENIEGEESEHGMKSPNHKIYAKLLCFIRNEKLFICSKNLFFQIHFSVSSIFSHIPPILGIKIVWEIVFFYCF